MCSEQFRGAAFLLNCSVQPFLSHSGLCNLQRIAALKWVDYSGGLAHPLHPPSLAPELHTVVQSHHLCLGCCFLCLLSAIARLRLLLQVLCQVLDTGPLPGPRSSVLPSALLLPASVLGSVGFLPHSITPLRRRARNMMGNILVYEEYTQLYPGGTVTRDLFGVARGGGLNGF